MGIIKILPENVINKIAAGEVVERPASVVKELVENSLDAHAAAITVAAKHAGKELVRVTDDGDGMSPDDAENALKRHATSKIATAEDIFAISSFGFRGEALPSIAAVSRLALLTRRKEDPAGTELKVEGGETVSVREAGTGPGTTVEVRDLFFNTPARRKFLRSDRAEYLAVLETLTALALGNPAVHFRLLHDTKKSFDLPACATVRDRIGQLHDEEIVEALVSLSAKTPEITISGFIANPTVSRVNRTGQYLFVNNRPIKSPGLSFALQQGYEELLPRQRYGIAFLFFDIALPRVDVNVHPNKKEVRVAQEREVQKLLVDAVRAALHTRWRSPAAQTTRPGTVLRDPGPALMPTRTRNLFVNQDAAPPSSRLVSACDPLPYGENWAMVEQSAIVDSSAETMSRKPESGCSDGAAPSVPRVVGQYQATYLIVEYQDKLLIIDQHAAHERVVFEEILQLFENGRPPSQRSLIPVSFTLDYREQEMLEACLPMLEHLGFGINDLGRNTYSIDAAPALVGSGDPKQIILDVLHQMLEGQMPRAYDDKKKAIAAAIACKKRAVKASARLQPEAMQHLAERLFKSSQPFTCPHGRPTCLTLTFDDLERQFGRK